MNSVKTLFRFIKEDIEDYKISKEIDKKNEYSENKKYTGRDLYRLVQEITKTLEDETKYYQQEHKKIYWENERLKKELEYYKKHQKIEIVDLETGFKNYMEGEN